MRVALYAYSPYSVWGFGFLFSVFGFWVTGLQFRVRTLFTSRMSGQGGSWQDRAALGRIWRWLAGYWQDRAAVTCPRPVEAPEGDHGNDCLRAFGRAVGHEETAPDLKSSPSSLVPSSLHSQVTFRNGLIKSNSQIYCCHGRVTLSKAYDYYQRRELSCALGSAVRHEEASPGSRWTVTLTHSHSHTHSHTITLTHTHTPTLPHSW